MNNLIYQNQLCKAMKMLSKESEVIFIGQNVKYSGAATFNSLKDISEGKKLELPVFENTQMGMSIGLSLEGFIPISIFPRIDFLICAIDQLVNHLDKCDEMSKGEFCPGVIIRTQLGNTKPLYPGPQHCGDYTKALKSILKNVEVIRLKDENEIITTYKHALDMAKQGLSTLIIESPSGVWRIN